MQPATYPLSVMDKEFSKFKYILGPGIMRLSFRSLILALLGHPYRYENGSYNSSARTVNCNFCFSYPNGDVFLFFHICHIYFSPC